MGRWIHQLVLGTCLAFPSRLLSCNYGCWHRRSRLHCKRYMSQGNTQKHRERPSFRIGALCLMACMQCCSKGSNALLHSAPHILLGWMHRCLSRCSLSSLCLFAISFHQDACVDVSIHQSERIAQALPSSRSRDPSFRSFRQPCLHQAPVDYTVGSHHCPQIDMLGSSDWPSAPEHILAWPLLRRHSHVSSADFALPLHRQQDERQERGASQRTSVSCVCCPRGSIGRNDSESTCRLTPFALCVVFAFAFCAFNTLCRADQESERWKS